MGKLMNSLFGGGTSSSSKASQQAQLAENRRGQEYVERMTGQARGDVMDLYPQALQMQNQGYQGTLDMIGAGIDPQLQAFQQGNIGAQQQLIGGMGNFQNAIMGMPTQQYQPMQIDYDTSFLQGVQLPQQQQQQQEPTPAQPNLPNNSYNPPNYGGNYQVGRGFGNFIAGPYNSERR